MKRLYDLPAPAKLNLFLHIVGRRDDGYHQLQSVFVLLDLADVIQMEWRPDGHISREDLPGSRAGGHLPAEDLTVRAARLLQKHAGVNAGVHLGLTKHTPAEAGLGGGSSDAATVLLGLNRLWNTGLNRAQLAELGRQLGADVPFFIHGTAAWVEGAGERVTPLAVPVQRYAVVKPPVGLSTAQVFNHPALTRNTPQTTLEVAGAVLATNPAFGRNDLQPVAQLLCPEVDWGLRQLASHGLCGRMTGSGSALFAQLAKGQPAPPFPGDWFQTVCTSLTDHPLLGWVD